jgi:hypothetical protein
VCIWVTAIEMVGGTVTPAGRFTLLAPAGPARRVFGISPLWPCDARLAPVIPPLGRKSPPQSEDLRCDGGNPRP